MNSQHQNRSDAQSTPQRLGVLKRGHSQVSAPSQRSPFSPSPAANKSVTIGLTCSKRNAPCSPVPLSCVASSPRTPVQVTPLKDCEESNIKVYIRTRPLPSETDSCCFLDPSGSSISLVHPSAKKGGKHQGVGEEFKFEDGVLPPDISQEELFQTVGVPAASAVLDGFNVTIFAYGQTGSGKTHSVYGSGSSTSGSTLDTAGTVDMGLTGRVVQYLLRSGRGREGVRWRYGLSLLDVYDEKVTDLFDLTEKQVREGGKKGKEKVYVEGAVWKAVGSASQAYEYLVQGLQGRHVAYTKLNSHSSRSHTICMLKVSQDKEEDGQVRNCTSVMTIVDLCGSERVKKSDVHGTRLKEAININQSLSALKTVIEALANGAGYVNYRSSKLTWLLRECIGGNAKVSLVAHVNPLPAHLDESKSTLRFVTVVKSVRTKSRRVERLKTEEEVEADERALAEEEEERRQLGFQDDVSPLEPDTQEWAGGPAPTLADAETQVSPGRCGGGVEALERALQRLSELRKAGILTEPEYRMARGKAVTEWEPPAKSEELSGGRLLELWREEGEGGEEEGEGGAGPERKRSRRSMEALRSHGTTLRFQGPGPSDQLKLLVRMTATFQAACAAFMSVHPELSPSSTSFSLRGQLLAMDTPMAELDLEDGEAVQVSCTM